MERILVEMTETLLGSDESDDGISLPVKEYTKGQKYIIGFDLFRCFRIKEACEVIAPKKHIEENKMIKPSLDNKSITEKPKKKRKRKKAKK